MLHWRFVAECVCLVWLLAAGWSLSSGQDQHYEARFAFQRPRNGPALVSCRINQRLDATFLIDTGSASSLITGDLVRRLRLAPQPAIGDDGRPLTITYPEAHNLQMVTLDQMQLKPSTTINKVPFIVWDTDQLRHFGPVPVDGVIGMNFFISSLVLLDMPAGRAVMWYPPDPSDVICKKVGMEDAVQVPIDVVGTEVYVTAELPGGGKVRMHLDTGGEYCQIPRVQAERMALKAVEEGVRHTFGPTMKTASAHVPFLKLGQLEFKNVQVDWNPVGDVETPPYLGMEVLGRCRLLIDAPHRRMLVKMAK